MPETGFTDATVATAAQLNQIEDQQVTTCTSTTRPTAVEGRMIFETDTEKVMISHDGVGWRLFGSSVWNDFAPSWSNISTSANDGAWRYSQGGMWIKVEMTASGAATGSISFTLPNSETSRNDGVPSWGTARFTDSSTSANTVFGGAICVANATTVGFRDGGNTVDATDPFTWASGDRIDSQIFVSL